MGFRLSLSLTATGLLALIGTALATDAPFQKGMDALARGDGSAAQAAFGKARKAGIAPEQLRIPSAKAALLQGDFSHAMALVGSDKDGMSLLGLTALRQGDVAKARALIESAVTHNTADPANWIALARVRIGMSDRAGADQAVVQALTLDPNNAEAIVLSGNLVRDVQGLTAALPWYDRALKATPGRLDALFEKAATLGDMGRARESLAVSRELIRVSPGHAQAYYQQAVIAARAGNFGLARGLMYRVGPRLDSQPGAILVSALAAFQGGNYDGAGKKLRNLLNMQPNNARVRRLLGYALWKQGQLADAIYTLGPIADRGDAYALVIIGRSYEAMGDRAAAATALDRAAHAQPAMPSAETMAQLDAFIAANPGNVWALRAAADRALSLGDASGAAALYGALKNRLGSGDPVRMVNTAWATALAGGDATDQAAQAYVRAPMNPLVTATYGAILRRAGDAERAVALLEKAVVLAPDEPRVADELAAAKADLAQRGKR